MEDTNQNRAIVCVDDEAILLIALKQELKKTFGDDYQYEVALNANEGMLLIDDLVESGVNILLILSDWLMPGIKGDEFLVQVHRKYPNIRSIMISGHIDDAVVAKVKREAGTYEVFPKPWDAAKLIAAVKHCCLN
ncbi:MAG: response regulator [Leptospira sp.]|nr:response regulator [Leptospira sp.]